jgi:hypothetical protein
MTLASVLDADDIAPPDRVLRNMLAAFAHHNHDAVAAFDGGESIKRRCGLLLWRDGRDRSNYANCRK